MGRRPLHGRGLASKPWHAVESALAAVGQN